MTKDLGVPQLNEKDTVAYRVNVTTDSDVSRLMIDFFDESEPFTSVVYN